MLSNSIVINILKTHLHSQLRCVAAEGGPNSFELFELYRSRCVGRLLALAVAVPYGTQHSLQPCDEFTKVFPRFPGQLVGRLQTPASLRHNLVDILQRGCSRQELVV